LNLNLKLAAFKFLLLSLPFLSPPRVSEKLHYVPIMSSAAEKGELKSIRVDASAEGCTGMYWRTKPVMSASTPSSGPGKGDDWPRNGTVLKGVWLSVGEERWVQFENGLYLPEKQAGFTILFEEK
jgi:hypothetical protein